MKHELFKDVTRQTLNVVGAVAQVGAGAVVGPGVGAVANENRSSILPAGYAFSIWSVIFLLFAAYAVYQALPSRRADPCSARSGRGRRERRSGTVSGPCFFRTGSSCPPNS
jgi:hypothetical protein